MCVHVYVCVRERACARVCVSVCVAGCLYICSAGKENKNDILKFQYFIILLTKTVYEHFKLCLIFLDLSALCDATLNDFGRSIDNCQIL